MEAYDITLAFLSFNGYVIGFLIPRMRSNVTKGFHSDKGTPL
jgi:hypothetical protein